jgi:hypothetical protein
MLSLLMVNCLVAYSQTPQAAVTFNLGPVANPTALAPGMTGLVPWIAKESLSSGSILRSLGVNASLWAYAPIGAGPVLASNIMAYIDSLPEDNGAGGILQVGSYWPEGGIPDNQTFANYNGAGWSNGHNGPGTTVTDTKTENTWSNIGPIDLSKCQLSVGNYQYTANYSGTMTVVYDGPGNDMVRFGIPGKPAIFRGGNTIDLILPFGTALTSLAPDFTICNGATCTVNGAPVVSGVTPIDFSNPVIYTVTAQDGISIKKYNVSITAPASTACNMDAFRINLPGSRVTLMPSGSVVVNVPAGTTNAQLAALMPNLTLSPGATCVSPNIPLSLTEPVHYLVTAQDGVTAKDYTATVIPNAEEFSLFALLTDTSGLTSADYDYLSLAPVSKHQNKGVPSVLMVSSPNDFSTDIYLQDYLRRYRPTEIKTINFSATIPNFSSSEVNAPSPLALSASLAISHWTTSSRIVLVSDELSTQNYPNVLQASALAAALDAPMLYYNPADALLVENAIAQLGATAVIYVNAAGTKPAIATQLLTTPASVVKYLKSQNIKVDYFAVTNPRDLTLRSGSKLSLTAPFIAARRTGIVVPVESYTPDTTEQFHYTGYPFISIELNELYQSIGRHPEYLALVGNATSIPLSYTQPNEQTGLYWSSPADLDYSNIDTDLFPDIAIGRIMAYNIFDATLLTSRISTYERLFDGVWENTTTDVGGQWNSAYQNVLAANYGFEATDLIGKTESPTQRVEAAIISHNDHSSQHVLGGAFDVGSQNLIAPAAIFSGGCATAAIDFETLVDGYCVDTTCYPPSDRDQGLLVVNRLFKLGAVAFFGSIRVDTGSGKMKISNAVNSLLDGQPLGHCYMAGIDVFTYAWPSEERRNWILLGDPGLRIHVPSAPVISPTNYVVNAVDPVTDHLVVNVPSTLFTPLVDHTWCEHWQLNFPGTNWGEKPGLYGMDVERFYMVRFTPDRPVLSVEALDTFPTVNSWVWGNTRLGWVAPPAIDYRQDGKDQLVWVVRANIMDWANPAGGTVPLAEMTNATFRINYAEELLGVSGGDNNPDGVLIYPNPASQYLDILFREPNGKAKQMQEEVLVYDAYGTCVLHQKNPAIIADGQLRISTAQLTAGIYFLKIGGVTKKFVVGR